jgi:hypothetical protein
VVGEVVVVVVVMAGFVAGADAVPILVLPPLSGIRTAGSITKFLIASAKRVSLDHYSVTSCIRVLRMRDGAHV